MTELGDRFNEGKERVELIPPAPLLEMGRLYGQGAIKYDDNNWRKGLTYTSTFGSMLRHLLKWIGGEDRDEETGCHHLSCVAWGCFAIMQFEEDGLKEKLDDRYVCGD